MSGLYISAVPFCQRFGLAVLLMGQVSRVSRVAARFGQVVYIGFVSSVKMSVGLAQAGRSGAFRWQSRF
jgi:hypothetical protein